MDTESSGERSRPKEPTASKPDNSGSSPDSQNRESSGSSSSSQNKEGGQSRPKEDRKDNDQPRGKEKGGNRKASKGESLEDRKRAERAKILTEEYDQAQTDSTRSAVRSRAEGFLASLGLKPKEIKKLSNKQVEDRVRLMTIAGAAKIEDLPPKTIVDLLKLSQHQEGQPRPDTPEVDRLLKEKGRATQEQVDTLGVDQKRRAIEALVEALPAGQLREEIGERAETSSDFYGRGRREYAKEDLSATPPPGIGTAEIQKAQDIINIANQAYRKEGKDPTKDYRKDIISEVKPAVEGMTFLEAYALKQELLQEREGKVEFELQEAQAKQGPLLEIVVDRLNVLTDEFEETGHGDTILKKTQDIRGTMRIRGREAVDDFIKQQEELSHDWEGEEAKFKGMRSYLVENAVNNLRGALSEEFMTSPADSQERITGRLLDRLDVLDESSESYRASDPTGVTSGFIRDAGQADRPFGSQLNKIYDARRTLHDVEIAQNLFGGNMERLQEQWRFLGKQTETVYKEKEVDDPDNEGQKIKVMVKEEKPVSNLKEFLSRYPGVGRAFGQFIVEADKQLNEVEIEIAERKKKKKTFSFGDIEAIKRKVEWGDLLMSHSDDAEAKAKGAVANALRMSMDDDKDRAAINLAFRLYRTFTPGIFEKTWTFDDEEGKTKYDVIPLDNGSPYFINMLQNPLDWMRKEGRANPEMVESFRTIFGDEVYPHLKIGTRVLRKMAGGLEENLVDQAYKKTAEARLDGRPQLFTEILEKRNDDEKLVPMAIEGMVQGTEAEWQARIEGITGNDFSDDVLDDSKKEVAFYAAMQQHFQKLDDKSLEELWGAIPSGKEYRWKGRLRAKDLLRHYIENRRKYDKSLFGRDSKISTGVAEGLIEKWNNTGRITKKEASELNHNLLGIGFGKLRIPGYWPVRWLRRAGEAGGTLASPAVGFTLLFAFVFDLFKGVGEQVKEGLKDSGGHGRH